MAEGTVILAEVHVYTGFYTQAWTFVEVPTLRCPALAAAGSSGSCRHVSTLCTLRPMSFLLCSLCCGLGAESQGQV